MNNFNFKKKLGQNFLIDSRVLQKITSAITPGEKDLIIEIGAGSGNLTKELKKFKATVIAYEIDLETKKYLDSLADTKTMIIYDDFLKRNIKDDLASLDYDNLFVIANLPYYITTPIIEKITISQIKPQKMLLMVQKEVAERLSAKPKNRDYGYITVYLNYYYQITKLIDVNRTAFKPIPNVDSAVLEFISQDLYPVDELKFIQLIKAAFKHKRKNLNNNWVDYDKELINKILLKHGFSLQSRAEELPVEIYIEITNAL